MWKLFTCALVLHSLVQFSYAQSRNAAWQDGDPTPPFEVYGLASGMRTVDDCVTVVINNPSPNQPLGFIPSGLASGARAGFVWRQDDIGIVADLGFHRYADNLGSTSTAPIMAGLRVYSSELLRTAFYGEFLAGGYRWTIRSKSINFTHFKGIVSVGGGMDVRLSHRLVFRVFDLQLMVAGAENGPLLTSRASAGIAYRFGGR